MRKFVSLLFVLIALPSYGKQLHKESWYQTRWCGDANKGGEVYGSFIIH